MHLHPWYIIRNFGMYGVYLVKLCLCYYGIWDTRIWIVLCMHWSNPLHILVERRHVFAKQCSIWEIDHRWTILSDSHRFRIYLLVYRVCGSASIQQLQTEKKKSIYELKLKSPDTSYWFLALAFSYIFTHHTILKQSSFPKNKLAFSKETIILELGCITRSCKQPALNDFGLDGRPDFIMKL